ncbi:MAG: hypothetical protein AAGE65_03195 [Planctomycetota bacterium]
MPSRVRLFAARTAAAVLMLAALAVLFTHGGDTPEPAVQTAGYALPSLIAAALMAAAALLAGPTVLFSIRRRKFKRILAAEG